MAEAQKTEMVRLASDMKALSPRTTEILLGLSVGAVGGALQGTLLSAPLAQSLLFGVSFGAAFALLFAKRTTSPGAGLMWGLAFAVLIGSCFRSASCRWRPGRLAPDRCCTMHGSGFRSLCLSCFVWECQQV